MATSFSVDLRLFTSAEGGRTNALRSGYRSVVGFGEEGGELWGVEITFDDRRELAPGESALVRVSAWADPAPPSDGTAIRLYEGERLVGTGTVRE